jgi:hypothetical protein
MLDATIAEYGENLSAGMRQCWSSAVLFGTVSRILLLDEATSSSVDYRNGQGMAVRFAGFPRLHCANDRYHINTIMDGKIRLVEGWSSGRVCSATGVCTGQLDVLGRLFIT